MVFRLFLSFFLFYFFFFFGSALIREIPPTSTVCRAQRGCRHRDSLAGFSTIRRKSFRRVHRQRGHVFAAKDNTADYKTKLNFATPCRNSTARRKSLTSFPRALEERLSLDHYSRASVSPHDYCSRGRCLAESNDATEILQTVIS